MAAASVEQDTLVFRLDDPEHRASRVRLWCDLPLGDTTFTRVEHGWELVLARPPVDRIEYLFDADGALGLDPGNPLRVPGAFGDHSWLPLPGYVDPWWLDADQVEHDLVPLEVRSTPVGGVDVLIWAPRGTPATEALPLLVAHDGPEMAAFGELARYAGALIATGRLPRFRLALLAPGARNLRYAANPAYTAALVEHVLPALDDAVASSGRPVLMGPSLGALAALHAAWTHPGAFGALFLQSGSFFRPDLDPQESGFEFWPEITGFVAEVHDATGAPAGFPPVTITCGSAEENHANNRLMADRLAALGVEVSWGEIRDTHTWTCWRDLLDPHLTELLGRVWEVC